MKKQFKDVIKQFIADVLINESYDFIVDWNGTSCSIYVSFIPSYALFGLVEASQSIADISIYPSIVSVSDNKCIEIKFEPINS